LQQVKAQLQEMAADRVKIVDGLRSVHEELQRERALREQMRVQVEGAFKLVERETSMTAQELTTKASVADLRTLARTVEMQITNENDDTFPRDNAVTRKSGTTPAQNNPELYPKMKTPPRAPPPPPPADLLGISGLPDLGSLNLNLAPPSASAQQQQADLPPNHERVANLADRIAALGKTPPSAALFELSPQPPPRKGEDIFANFNKPASHSLFHSAPSPLDNRTLYHAPPQQPQQKQPLFGSGPSGPGFERWRLRFSPPPHKQVTLRNNEVAALKRKEDFLKWEEEAFEDAARAVARQVQQAELLYHLRKALPDEVKEDLKDEPAAQDCEQLMAQTFSKCFPSLSVAREAQAKACDSAKQKAGEKFPEWKRRFCLAHRSLERVGGTVRSEQEKAQTLLHRSTLVHSDKVAINMYMAAQGGSTCEHVLKAFSEVIVSEQQPEDKAFYAGDHNAGGGPGGGKGAYHARRNNPNRDHGKNRFNPTGRVQERYPEHDPRRHKFKTDYRFGEKKVRVMGKGRKDKGGKFKPYTTFNKFQMYSKGGKGGKDRRYLSHTAYFAQDAKNYDCEDMYSEASSIEKNEENYEDESVVMHEQEGQENSHDEPDDGYVSQGSDSS
jgi:hypothetical protein